MKYDHCYSNLLFQLGHLTDQLVNNIDAGMCDNVNRNANVTLERELIESELVAMDVNTIEAKQFLR